MEMPPIVLIIGSYFAIAGGVWALFDRADKALKDEAKDSISQWLLELKPSEGNQKWPGQFIKIFDAVFSEKHLSWKCFFRSCIASYIAITIMLLIYIGIDEGGFFIPSNGQIRWADFVGVYFLGGILNLIPDYVSLLETRLVLRRMKDSKSFLKTFVLLGFDLIISALLIGGPFLLYFVVFFFNYPPVIPEAANYYDASVGVLKSSISFSGDVGLHGIFIYSTFFTSVWLWLYGLSGFLIKTSQRMGLTFQWLKNILDFESKPLPSLGLVSSFIILFFYIIGFGFFYNGKYF